MSRADAARRGIAAAALAAGLLLTPACSRKPESKPEDAPLARVGKVSITESDFEREIQRRREAGRPIESADAILNEMIRRQAMLQRAESSDVMTDPAAQRERENQLLAQWRDRTIAQEKDRVSVSDEELRRFYERHQDKLGTPAMTRLAILFRRLSPHDPQEQQDAVRADLEAGREAYLKDPKAATQEGRLQGFGTVAAQYSEDTISRYRGGDVGWIQEGDADGRLPPEVIELGNRLNPGQVSEVTAIGEGLYVVMKCDQRAARAATFEDVAPTLRRRAIREKQDELERKFMDNLLAAASVQINTEKAARLRVPDSTAENRLPALVPVDALAPKRGAP